MQKVIIKPTRGFVRPGLGDLLEYRELLYFLTWRDIKVRYKQTVFGAAWAILQPLLLMIVYSVFARVVDLPSHGVPYPVFAFSALVPWTLFSQSLNGASNSLVGGSHLISKVYFPRLLLPLGSAMSFLLDFVIALLVLIGMMLVYGVPLRATVVWTPLLAALIFTTSVGAGIWLAGLNVKYRDIRYALPLLLQVWLFASPVVYSSTLIPEKWRWAYSLNPMAAPIENFRWALLGVGRNPGPELLLSAAFSFVILLLGTSYFRHVERTFADVI